MKELLAIEQGSRQGKRLEKYGPRTIDIDILLFNDDIYRHRLLTHTASANGQRRFVLEPLNEIAPDYIHPVLKKTIAQLLNVCPDPLPVKKFSCG